MTFGFDGEKPKPARESALLLAKAIIELVRADARLEKAISEVPSYTGQWDDEDYYAAEQEEFYRAADRLADIVGLP